MPLCKIHNKTVCIRVKKIKVTYLFVFKRVRKTLFYGFQNPGFLQTDQNTVKM